MQQEVEINSLVMEYWSWLAAALFLLTTVDMLTTFYAVRQVGLEHESNPVVRTILSNGPLALMIVNLLVVILVTLLFDKVMLTFRRTPSPFDWYFARLIEAWLGGLFALGLFVFANNLAVIFLGSSLL